MKSESLKDVFALERASLKDVRALGGEVVEVPVRPGKLAEQHLVRLADDLARFMCNFTGRGYDVSRETMTTANTRYVREPGHEAFGLKVFVDGNRILIGRVAILEDETILTTYLSYLRNLDTEDKPKPQVTIDVPDDFGSDRSQNSAAG